MSTADAQLLEKLSARASVPLWLDDVEYAMRRLAGNQSPWADVAAYIAWRRQAQSLLRSDVLAFPLQDALIAWVVAHADDLSDLRTRSPRQILKSLFAMPRLRSSLVDYVTALRSSWPTSPLALTCPLPADLAKQLLHSIRDEDIEVSEDDADSASVYVADLLREFGGIGIDGLLLGSVNDCSGAIVDEAFCQPLLNVCSHYHWSAGQFLPPGVSDRGLAFVVTTASSTKVFAGTLVGDSFWTSDVTAPSTGCFRYARVPTELTPEVVLSKIERLRQ